ncbi:esterase/lipase family protein [Rosenbergiella nectarea]|uniref:esterase/lipase family protein n=1 Tax=Rosenbergiella nectarea TaxID=988801 RepID=UPI001F4EA1EB|nr:GPI inositol-deacylase [Rosenbergiella nectarea]
MDDNENSAYHRPVWNDDGRFYYEIIPQAKAKNYVAVCLKPADKVIPVIFIPGVMGSNLKNGKSKVWQFSFSSLKKWPLAGPEKRKFLLDPQTTTVDDSGKILNNGADGKKFPSRRKRGWGSAFYKSYGEALDRLQYLLSDDDILMDNYFRKMQLQTARQRFTGVKIGDEPAEQVLTEEDTAHGHRFLYPLHVFGYNWLQYNTDSAVLLGTYIRKVLGDYRGRLAVNKVILVTHSMGGLVARHYSENMNGQENILGIVHGVMPDLGSPAAYRRMKTGERGVTGMIIGNSAVTLMPVLAQSPGPLQLLPGKAYGPGWLKIEGGSSHQSLPVNDPYEEIYLNKTAWWRLCEQDLLLGDIDNEWTAFVKRIKYPVKKFIEELNGKYHPQTWLFYGASANNPSDAFLTWKERPVLRPVPVMGYPEPSSPTYRYDAGKTFELISAGTPGDGTMPVTAIRTTSPRIRGILATDVDHEGAYAVDPVDRSRSVYRDLSDALMFTVRSVVKIVQQVPVP